MSLENKTKDFLVKNTKINSTKEFQDIFKKLSSGNYEAKYTLHGPHGNKKDVKLIGKGKTIKRERYWKWYKEIKHNQDKEYYYEEFVKVKE